MNFVFSSAGIEPTALDEEAVAHEDQRVGYIQQYNQVH